MGINSRKFAFGVLVLILFVFSGFIMKVKADTLYFKNGRSITGLIKSEDDQNVELEVGFGTVKFSKKQIERIEKSSLEEAVAIKQKWEEDKLEAQNRAKEEKARKEAEPKEVLVDNKSGHMMVEATLNKKVKVSLMLDTGASLIVLSNAVAKKLGIDLNAKDMETRELVLGDGRKVEAKYVVLDSVRVQEAEMEKVGAAILPEDLKDTAFQDGALGMSFLKNFNFKIDQKNNKLILEKL